MGWRDLKKKNNWGVVACLQSQCWGGRDRGLLGSLTRNTAQQASTKSQGDLGSKTQNSS